MSIDTARTRPTVTAVDDDDESGLIEVAVRDGSVAKAADDDAFMKSAKVLKSNEGVSSVTKRRISNEIRKFNRGVDGAESTKHEFEDVTGYQAFDVVQPPYNLDYLAKLFEISPPHAGSVEAKVSNIVGLGYDLIESPKAKQKIDGFDGDQSALDKFRKKMNRAKDDILDRLDQLNEEDTFQETLMKVWTDYEATGNGYLEIGRTANSQVGYIGHIPSTTMRLRRERDGFVQIVADKTVFFRNFGDKKTGDPIGNQRKPNEVIHFKRYAPSSAYYGIAAVISAKNAIAGNEFSDRFNLDYFEHKAVPKYVVILKGGKLSARSERLITEFFETNMRGKNFRSLFVPLEGHTKENPIEFDIKPVEQGSADSSFLNYRKENLEQILMAHRVPITKVGAPAGMNLAIARDLDKTFKEQVTQPMQKIVEKKLNRILSEMTDIFVFKLNELSLTDADQQSQIDERNIRSGARTADEVRSRDGYAHVDGGEKTMPKADHEAQAEQASQRAAQQKANAGKTRARDAQRSAKSPDKSGEPRNPKGEGRQVR